MAPLPHCLLLYNSTCLPSLSPLCFSIKLHIFFSLFKKKNSSLYVYIYNHTAKRKDGIFVFCFFTFFFCVFIWSDELRSGWLLRDYYFATHDVPRMKFYMEKRAWWVLWLHCFSRTRNMDSCTMAMAFGFTKSAFFSSCLQSKGHSLKKMVR